MPHDKLTVDLPKDVDSTEVTDGGTENGERILYLLYHFISFISNVPCI